MSFVHSHSYFSETELAYVGGIIHRDLKTDNVLITKMFSAKVCDFGESRRKAFDEDMTTVGTADFAAPEIVEGGKYDEKVDVYSFGIMLAEMERHKKPYEGESRNGLTQRILQGFRPKVSAVFQSTWPTIYGLMVRCWDKDPQNRPSMRTCANVLFESEQKSEGASREKSAEPRRSSFTCKSQAAKLSRAKFSSESVDIRRDSNLFFDEAEKRSFKKTAGKVDEVTDLHRKIDVLSELEKEAKIKSVGGLSLPPTRKSARH